MRNLLTAAALLLLAGIVLFLTVTGAAPISAMLFNTPLSVGYGNGIGTPAGFAFATVILTIFSVGYVAMARKVTAAGGFYSFISHGLGRELGMASGLAMVVAYSVFEASRYLQIPENTLRSWVSGRSYPLRSGANRRSEPVIELADSANSRLSFSNLTEAHVLDALRP